MKIAILGGTGHFGKGLSFRWAKNHEILIGSRDERKAVQTANLFNAELSKFAVKNPIVGMTNPRAIQQGEIIVLSLRYNHLLPLLKEARSLFHSQIILSPVVPLMKKDFFQYIPPPEGSAALAIRSLLPDSCKVIAALHTIPAAEMSDPARKIEGDVVVCGEEGESKSLIQKLVGEIENLRVLNGGPLEVSKLVEPITPLILNLKHFGLKRDLTIKFI